MPAAATIPGPVALICGDDDFSVKQRARAVFDAWSAELGGMDHETLDGSATHAGDALQRLYRLRDALNTLPFFGGAKVVWLQNCNFLGEDRTASSSSVTEALGEFAEELKRFRWDGVRLLISAGKPDKRRTFYKTLEKLGTVEAFNALSADDKDWAAKIESEAIRLLRDAGQEIEEDALGELVSRVGANSRLLASEVEKLHLFAAGRASITRTDVETVVSRQKHARAFALAEALGDRDLVKLLRTLDEELWEIRAGVDKKKSEIGLLYGLISKIRAMILLKELVRQGHIKATRDYNSFKTQLDRIPPAALPADRRYNPLAGHPFVVFQALRQVGNYQLPELVNAMERLLEANRQLVSSDLDEALVLQRVMVEIVGPPARRSAMSAA
jgi:DNA polymerase III subunit delta